MTDTERLDALEAFLYQFQPEYLHVCIWNGTVFLSHPLREGSYPTLREAIDHIKFT